jgi:tetratricopeptide (TPR) repeat protein
MGDLAGAAQQVQPIRSDALVNQKAMLLGQIAFAQQQHKEAIQHFSKALAQESDFARADPDSAFAYAESLIQTGKPGEALDLLTKAMARCPATNESPNQVHLGLLQSRCFLSLKQPEKAIATLEHLVTVGPQDNFRDQLNYRLSELYIENKQPEKAKAKLAELTASSQSFWKAAAQQQLDYMEMQSKERVKTN